MAAEDASKAFAEYAKHCSLMRRYVDTLKRNSKMWYPDKLKELADKRKMSIECLEKCEVFYIGQMQEMLVPDFLDYLSEFGVISATNNKPIFENRYVFPVKDYCGNIINLVGYTWTHDVRYVYGTGRYYERSNDFYGAEQLKSIYENGWCVVVEGITDCVALRNIGVYGSLATCGTAASVLKMNQLSRLEYGVIFIHDRDKAGDETRKHWVVPRSVRINIMNGSKDADEYLNGSDDAEIRKEAADNLLLAINEAVEWLKQGSCKRGNRSKPVSHNLTLF